MRGFFDLAVMDEVHELKARGSAQGLAGAALAEACPRTLVLTGTLLRGYASNLFHLFYRFSPAIRTEFAHDDEAKWIARYGYLERITKSDPNAYTDDGRQSKRRGYATRIVEKPGVTPPVLFKLRGIRPARAVQYQRTVWGQRSDGSSRTSGDGHVRPQPVAGRTSPGRPGPRSVTP
jgi:superfamily II DNA or RNA helicase